MIKVSKSKLPTSKSEMLAKSAAAYLIALKTDQKDEAAKIRENYKHVKKLLVQDSHNKCAYCESYLGHVSSGQTDHVLPVSRHPSLVFDWQNLVLACEKCNRFKSNYDDESLPLVHPVNDQPSDHLTFLGPFMSDITLSGEATSKELELNRPELIATRLESLKKIKSETRRLRELTSSQVQSMIVKQLWKEVDCSKEYSAMLNLFLRAELLLLDTTSSKDMSAST